MYSLISCCIADALNSKEVIKTSNRIFELLSPVMENPRHSKLDRGDAQVHFVSDDLLVLKVRKANGSYISVNRITGEILQSYGETKETYHASIAGLNNLSKEDLLELSNLVKNFANLTSSIKEDSNVSSKGLSIYPFTSYFYKPEWDYSKYFNSLSKLNGGLFDVLVGETPFGSEYLLYSLARVYSNASGVSRSLEDILSYGTFSDFLNVVENSYKKGFPNIHNNLVIPVKYLLTGSNLTYNVNSGWSNGRTLCFDPYNLGQKPEF